MAGMSRLRYSLHDHGGVVVLAGLPLFIFPTIREKSVEVVAKPVGGEDNLQGEEVKRYTPVSAPSNHHDIHERKHEHCGSHYCGRFPRWNNDRGVIPVDRC